jgi:hypothetical protein
LFHGWLELRFLERMKMNMKHAIEFMQAKAPVEDRNDEDFKTGTIVEIVNERFAIVHWDDDEGTLAICEIRDLVGDQVNVKEEMVA